MSSYPSQFRSRRPADVRLNVFDWAAEVVSKVDQQNPADAVLRAELKRQRDIPPELSRSITQAVFAYYRWWTWLKEQPLDDQLHQAMQLQERFSDEPSTFTFEELASKAMMANRVTAAARSNSRRARQDVKTDFSERIGQALARKISFDWSILYRFLASEGAASLRSSRCRKATGLSIQPNTGTHPGVRCPRSETCWAKGTPHGTTSNPARRIDYSSVEGSLHRIRD